MSNQVVEDYLNTNFGAWVRLKPKLVACCLENSFEARHELSYDKFFHQLPSLLASKMKLCTQNS